MTADSPSDSNNPTFDEMLAQTWQRWTDVRQRLEDAVKLTPVEPYIRSRLQALLDDVRKWEQEAKKDYDAF